jgi:hypothetical protein
MTGLTCTAVRRRLGEFHDGELPVQKRIEIQGHLNVCGRVPRRAARIRGRLVRAAAGRGTRAGGRLDRAAASGVIGRMRAEANEAWLARMGACSTTCTWCGSAWPRRRRRSCAARSSLGMLHYASPEREDSLRALITVIGAVRARI